MTYAHGTSARLSFRAPVSVLHGSALVEQGKLQANVEVDGTHMESVPSGRSTWSTVSLIGTLEDAFVVGYDQPEVGSSSIVTKPELAGHVALDAWRTSTALAPPRFDLVIIGRTAAGRA